MENNKKFIASALIIVAAFAVGSAGYFYGNQVDFFSTVAPDSSQALALHSIAPIVAPSTPTNFPIATSTSTTTKPIPSRIGVQFCAANLNTCTNAAKGNDEECEFLADGNSSQDQQCDANYGDQMRACINAYQACMNTTPTKPTPTTPTNQS